MNYKFRDTKYAVKKMTFETNDKIEFMKELENIPLIGELNHVNIVKYYSVWLENNSICENGIKKFNDNFTLNIQMELCDTSLREVIYEIEKDTNFYNNKSLTNLGYYFSCIIFMEILQWGQIFARTQSTYNSQRLETREHNVENKERR